jgi:hypothetical protein
VWVWARSSVCLRHVDMPCHIPDNYILERIVKYSL